MSGFGYNVNGFGAFPSRGPAPIDVNYAVVAGGAGGGGNLGGGGGAGGVLLGALTVEVEVGVERSVG